MKGNLITIAIYPQRIVARRARNSMNNAYELLPKLKNLTLFGVNEGELEWIGTEEDWNKVNLEIENHENSR